MGMKYTKHISLPLILAMLLMLTTGCGKSGSVGSADAGSMKLEAFEGTAHVTDESGSEADAREHMNLYSGYGVGTEQTSYAWIDLDADKMLKLDEVSRAGLSQEDKHLRITLEQGAMFFCLQKLAEDETMEIDTDGDNPLTLAIRGTTGFIKKVSETEYIIGLYEGEVEVSCGDESFTIKTGEKAEVTTGEGGQLDVHITALDIAKDTPTFVLNELFEEEVREKLEKSKADTSVLEEIERSNESITADEILARIGSHSRWRTENGTGEVIYDDSEVYAMGLIYEGGQSIRPFDIKADPGNVTAISENSVRISGEATVYMDTKFHDAVYILTISDDNNTLTMDTNVGTYVFTRQDT